MSSRNRRRPVQNLFDYAHRARATTEFVASTDGRLKLFLLPAYSPELNPDEWA